MQNLVPEIVKLLVPVLALLIPIVAVLSLVVARPLLKALAKRTGTPQAGVDPERVAALEDQLALIRTSLTRVLEEQDFQRRLRAAPAMAAASVAGPTAPAQNT